MRKFEKVILEICNVLVTILFLFNRFYSESNFQYAFIGSFMFFVWLTVKHIKSRDKIINSELSISLQNFIYILNFISFLSILCILIIYMLIYPNDDKYVYSIPSLINLLAFIAFQYIIWKNI